MKFVGENEKYFGALEIIILKDTDLNQILEEIKKENIFFVFIKIKSFHKKLAHFIQKILKDKIVVGCSDNISNLIFFTKKTKVDFVEDDFFEKNDTIFNQVVLKNMKEKNISIFVNCNFLREKTLCKYVYKTDRQLKFARKYKIDILLSYLDCQKKLETSSNFQKIIKIFKISNEQIKNNFEIISKMREKKLEERSEKYVASKIRRK